MLKKIITWAIVIFIIFYIATEPSGAAGIVHSIFNGLHSAATSRKGGRNHRPDETPSAGAGARRAVGRRVTVPHHGEVLEARTACASSTHQVIRTRLAASR